MQSFSRYGARFTSGVYGVHLIPAMHAGMHVAGSGGDDVVVRARRATRAHHAMDGCRHGQAPCFVVRVSHVAGAVMPYARANLELISHAVECMGISRCCISPSRSILCLSIVN